MVHKIILSLASNNFAFNQDQTKKSLEENPSGHLTLLNAAFNPAFRCHCSANHKGTACSRIPSNLTK